MEPRCINAGVRAQMEEMAEWRRHGEALSAKEAESASGETYACQQVNSAYQVSWRAPERTGLSCVGLPLAVEVALGI